MFSWTWCISRLPLNLAFTRSFPFAIGLISVVRYTFSPVWSRRIDRRERLSCSRRRWYPLSNPFLHERNQEKPSFWHAHLRSPRLCSFVHAVYLPVAASMDQHAGQRQSLRRPALNSITPQPIPNPRLVLDIKPGSSEGRMVSSRTSPSAAPWLDLISCHSAERNFSSLSLYHPPHPNPTPNVLSNLLTPSSNPSQAFF